MNDVKSWLAEIGLERYADIFAQQAIEWDVLADLTEADLVDLGIPLGHRKRLLKAIGELSRSNGTAAYLGQGLSASSAQLSGPERRNLTVMFCDLVGSTALARQLDPEDLRPIIRAYQDCCAGVVARLDGFTSRYIGDGVLIYFGYPRAHEDDAERALRGSREIIEAVRRIHTGTGSPLQTRIGVATGLVLVGDLLGSDPALGVSALGDPLNIASRLQGLAEPDGIVVDKTTRQLTAGVFTFADLGERSLKGVSEPVQVWAVTGENDPRSRFEATRGARIVPFVNRSHELQTLLSRWEAAKKGAGQLVLIAGEPGIGKSRLAQIFQGRLAGQPHTKVHLNASPYHQSTALYPVVEQVKRAASLSGDDTPDRKLEKIAAYFAGMADIGEAVSLFAALLSIPEGKPDVDISASPGNKDNAFKVLIEQVIQLSADDPLLIAVEDAQWLDPTSLELLDAVADRIAHRRVLMLVTYRSDFALPLADRPGVTVIQLDRLRRAECQTMVEHLAARKLVPPDLLNEIVARADGVALFVEELTKAVLESDILIDRGDRYELRSAAPALAIPATLNGSLMARLDRYPEARDIAQIGSVIGREFTYDVFLAVAQQPEARLRVGLERLVDNDLLLRVDTSPQATYRFKHALVQDAAYESLLLSRRRILHARVAEVIESRFPDTVAIEPALLAHHFNRAGAPEKAIAYFLKAGRLALARSAMAEAIAALRMGLELLPNLPAGSDARGLELELQVLLGHALRAARAPSAPETGEAWDRARQLCRPTGDAVYLQQVLYGQFLFHQGNANLARARQLGEELLALEEKERDRAAFVRGHSAVGRTAFGQGDFVAAREHLEQALSVPDQVFRQSADLIQGPESRVLNLCYLSWALFVQGHAAQAAARCAESIAVAERLAQPYDLVVARGNACYMHQFRRDLAAVAAGADAVIALAGERGFAAWLSLGQIFRGWVLTQQGDIAAGLPLIEQALRDHLETGERLEVPYFLGLLAECCGKAGRTAAGLSAIDEALAMSASTGETWFNPELRRIQGDLRLGDATGAVRCYRQAADIARAQGARMWELRATLSLARHEPVEARPLLRHLLASLDQDADIAEIREASVLARSA